MTIDAEVPQVKVTTCSDDEQVWSVYLIRTRLNTLYAGVTTDVDRRFKEHASNSKKGARYLRGKGPLALMWHQAIGDKREAMRKNFRLFTAHSP